jgi:F0F1-type ATP synthase gamma subunit
MATHDRRMTQTDQVRQLIDMIAAEKTKIEESLEAISEYAERLRMAAADASQRLIGRG